MVSLTRVISPEQTLTPEQWLAHFSGKFSGEDLALMQGALELAQTYYPKDAKTQMGEPMLSHVLSATYFVDEMHIFADALAATVLSALPVYCKNWQELTVQKCNASIARLVEGIDQVQKLTKFANIEKINTPEEHQQQAESMRKMLIAMVSDIRVVLIKLAMRTRTMHFMASIPDSDLKREIAKETLDIFAPLANRLGVWQLKWLLEDLGFRYQNPEAYSRIAKLLDEKRTERMEYINNVVSIIEGELGRLNIHCEVAGRPKHIYSIYKKMTKKKLDFSGLYDIRAVRVLVDTVPQCYTTLGIIHSMWQPIPGEFDDYIAHPKSNDYQSLHTVVVGPKDKGVEIQIRTFDMHQFAEFGVAAHWRYKEGGEGDKAYEQKISWLRQLLEWRENVADNEQDSNLAEAFQTELFNDTIYVLTPHGKVLSLPVGATPIDFAYAVHTDLGHRCRGAKVNGQIVPLSTALENGQRVEIITVKEGHPSVNWLLDGWVKSSKATSKIRAYIRAQNAESVRENGRTILDKQLNKLSMRPNLQHLCEALGYTKLDDLYLALGHGEVTPRTISNAATQLMRPEETATEFTEANIVRKSRAQTDKSGVLVDGEGGLLTFLAKCCKPAPPDAIAGFVTKGRGISVHRQNCAAYENLAQLHPDKIVSTQWSELKSGQVFPIDIEITARDRNGLLRDVSEAFSRNKLNVIGVNTITKDALATMRFTVEIKQVEELPRVISNISDVKGVYTVNRL